MITDEELATLCAVLHDIKLSGESVTIARDLIEREFIREIVTLRLTEKGHAAIESRIKR
jgi:hypothetical protein